MAISASIIPGKVFEEGEAVNISTLNLLGNPTVNIEGAVSGLAIEDDSITDAKVNSEAAIATSKLALSSAIEVDGTNVGIGTETPTLYSSATKGVHVSGTNAELKLETDSSSGWAFIHCKSPESDWAFGIDDDENFRISNNSGLTSNTAITIDTAENVGIGGTAGNKLHVICDDDDGIRISAGTAAAHGDKNARILALNTAGTFYNDLELRASETRIYSDGTPTMTIDSDGQSTFTRTTRGSNIKLELADDGALTGPLLTFYRNSASPADDDDLGKINFSGNNDAAAEVSFAYIECEAKDVSDGSQDGDLIFGTVANGSGAEAMRIDSNGTTSLYGARSGDAVTDALLNFGITNSNGDLKKAQIKAVGVDDIGSELVFGTTHSHSYAERMRIASDGDVKIGNGSTATASTDADDLVIDKGGADTGLSILSTTTGRIYFGDAANNDAGSIRYVHTGDAANSMRFETDDEERMRIDSSGNVGIGGAPDSLLDVTAATAPTVQITNTTGHSSIGAGVTIGSIKFNSDADGTDANETVAEMRVKSAGAYNNADHPTSLGFYVAGDAADAIPSDPLMLIDGSNSQVILPNLPDADPGVAGALYSDGATSAGVPKALMISGG